MTYCPDCGPATVSHAVERWTVRIDGLIAYLARPPELIWQAIRPAVAYLRPGRLAPGIFRMFAMLGLGRILTQADENNNWRARVLWEEATRRGIVMREFRPFNLAREIYFAAYGHDTLVFDGLPRPRLAHRSAQDWMDDKGVILKKFRREGIPVPRGRACKNTKEAEEVFREIGVPVVVKPNIGSRSRHTYTHITDEEALRRAFQKAKELSPRVVVEEELPGFVFRVTLIGGRIVGVMRREPPHVMGDGKHTVRELVEMENKNPLRRGPIFHELRSNGDDARAILGSQDLSEASVPENGRMVILHSKVSRSYGASTTEIAKIHPDNVALFLKIAQVLDDPLVGVDFMIEDMARPWREERCGVIECNSLPFIDLHHYPLKGPTRNVAGAVWDLTFPGSGRK
jgi:D-alanine-D-alanine ligase-like ATP-grasp enzyme